MLCVGFCLCPSSKEELSSWRSACGVELRCKCSREGIVKVVTKAACTSETPEPTRTLSGHPIRQNPFAEWVTQGRPSVGK
jgi:CO dehydrogenase/acetyl-CoA synthase alpha subunit